MPDDTSQDLVDAEPAFETDLIDLDGVTLAEVASFGENALGRTLSRMFADTGEQVASFHSSI